MAFPDTPLDLRPELLINGTWTDVSTFNDHGPLVVARGHPDESTTVTASTLTLSLTNTDARFSSKNPVGPYYPYLMRNVQCRVSAPSQTPYLRLEADSSDRAYVNEVSRLDITGSLEARIELRPSDWSGAILAAKWDTAGCWYWQLNAGATLTFGWFDSGAAFHSVVSTAAVPMLNAQVALRVTLNASTGAVTFYTAPSIDGTYTQLGAVVSATGATSVATGASALVVGWSANFTGELLGAVTGFRLYNGIGGTVVADAAFSVQTAGVTTWTDAPGNTWNLAGGAEISSRIYRGHFEVPEWPQHQDASGKTATVAASGGGLLRRLSQRNNPVSSTMYRAWTRAPLNANLAAYWPMEDGAQATRFAAAAGPQAMYFSGAPQLASSSAFACSGSLPAVNGAVLSGNVSYPGPWTDNQTVFLMQIPSGGELNGSAICAITSQGTIATLIVNYFTGGSLTLTGFSAAGAQLFTSGTQLFGVNGKELLVEVGLQNAGGGNLTWSLQTLAPGASGALNASGTVAGTIGAVTRAQLNPYGTQGLLQAVFGHCAVRGAWVSLFALAAYQNPVGVWTGALSAWAAEPAGVRFARLCAEEGIQFRGRGNLTATPLMGVQTAQTVAALLQECADADRGVWAELRQQLGFGYTCRQALYNQPAGVTVDYAQDHLGMWSSDPTEDDQVIQNDITVAQTSGGSSSRQYAAPGQPITGGRLSTLPPPAGAGTYDQSFNINLAQADDLDGEASWMVHVGTTDQPRFPGIVLDLANRALASQFWAILGMDLADRLVINDPPAQYGPDPVSQLAQQVTETMWGKQYEIAVCGVPEQPYEVAVIGSFNIDTDGTTLQSGVTAVAQSLSFVTAAGFPVWTTAGGDFPFDVMIAGERVTVTNITGSSSPQTATVTRSVNGVVKAQSAGAAVNVYPSPVIGL
jgi:hypothetical protein